MARLPLTCTALNCTLKPDGPSSTQLMLEQIAGRLDRLEVTTDIIRVVTADVAPGVQAEAQTPDDGWPAIRDRILASDILLLGTPIWLGNPSSVCRRVLERLDAFISETDEQGRMALHGKVAGVAVVGNEDGAHNVSAQAYQAMSDVGFTIPYNATSYWVGEAMGSTDYEDLDQMPDRVDSTMQMMVTNLAHLARALKASPYPPPGD
jgi:multimeric flavodoxin WrbA